MKKSGLLAFFICTSTVCFSAGSASAQSNYRNEYGASNAYSAQSQPQSVVPYFGAKQADWLKRFELTWTFLDPGRSEQSVLTTQPIYQSGANAIFFQGSVNRYALYGDYRWNADFGAGYRRLLADNSILVGANAFFDNEFNHGNRRASLGAEAQWYAVDFNFNEYIALTDDKDADGNIERALSGRDFNITTQVPYLPWVKAGIGYFWFDKERAAKTMNGYQFQASFALHPNFNLEYKWSSYEVNNNAPRGQNAVMLNFSLARLDEPTLSTARTVSDKVFETRDLSKNTLEKVIRENRVVSERRTTGGVVYVGPAD